MTFTIQHVRGSVNGSIGLERSHVPVIAETRLPLNVLEGFSGPAGTFRCLRPARPTPDRPTPDKDAPALLQGEVSDLLGPRSTSPAGSPIF